jgi:hypothetical protein
MFSVCASCGAFMASFLNNVVAPQSGEDGEDSPLTLKQSAQNMLGLVWRSRALKLLIPLIFYSGADYFFLHCLYLRGARTQARNKASFGAILRRIM